jgi:hypothetical protein
LKAKKTPLPFPVAGFVVLFFRFAFLDRNPAVPNYENENNEAKEYDDRVAHGHVKPRGACHGAGSLTLCDPVGHGRRFASVVAWADFKHDGFLQVNIKFCIAADMHTLCVAMRQNGAFQHLIYANWIFT